MALLTSNEVAAAALKVVDQDGLEAISMRRVGDALGVSAMSLYHYFPSKEALLDAVFQAVLVELPPLRRGGGWQAMVRRRALEFRITLARHPKAIALFATRPAATLASLERVEETLAMLRAAGFSARNALSLFQIVLAFVVGHTMSSLAEPVNVPDYAKLDAEKFSSLRAVAAIESYDVDDEFELGVSAIVNGFPAPRRR